MLVAISTGQIRTAAACGHRAQNHPDFAAGGIHNYAVAGSSASSPTSGQSAFASAENHHTRTRTIQIIIRRAGRIFLGLTYIRAIRKSNINKAGVRNLIRNGNFYAINRAGAGHFIKWIHFNAGSKANA